MKMKTMCLLLVEILFKTVKSCSPIVLFKGINSTTQKFTCHVNEILSIKKELSNERGFFKKKYQLVLS